MSASPLCFRRWGWRKAVDVNCHDPGHAREQYDIIIAMEHALAFPRATCAKLPGPPHRVRFMKKTTAIFACLMLASGTLAAQNTGYSGMINRDVEAMGQQVSAPTAAMDISNQDIEAVREENRRRQITVSYDPADLDDTTGMEAYEVFTWTDRRGVRHYTDDRKKAPSSARVRNIYSMPPATKIDDPDSPTEYKIVIEKERPSDS